MKKRILIYSVISCLVVIGIVVVISLKQAQKNIEYREKLIACKYNLKEGLESKECTYHNLYHKCLADSHPGSIILKYCLGHRELKVVNVLFKDGSVRDYPVNVFKETYEKQVEILQKAGLHCEYERGIIAELIPIITKPKIASHPDLAGSESHESEEVQKWLGRLPKGLLDERCEAVEALVQIGEKNPQLVVSDIIRAFKKLDYYQCLNAIECLRRIGEKNSNIVMTALILALKDYDQHVRYWSAEAMSKLREKAASAVPALIFTIEDIDGDVRRSAIKALGNVGEKAGSAVPALISSCKNEDKYIRYWAAWALGEIGEKAVEAMPILISTLKDEKSRDVRFKAAEALGKIGKTAKSYLPEIKSYLEYPNSEVRCSCAVALFLMGEEIEKAQAILLAELKNDTTNNDVVFDLGDLGSKASFAVPTLEALLQSSDYRSLLIEEALKKIQGK